MRQEINFCIVANYIPSREYLEVVSRKCIFDAPTRYPQQMYLLLALCQTYTI